MYALIQPDGRAFEHANRKPICDFCYREADHFYQLKPGGGALYCKECWEEYCDFNHRVEVKGE